MKRLWRVVFLLYGTVSSAQNMTGSIAGAVTDAITQQPLLGANVFIESVKIGGTTDATGAFQFNAVPVGTYKLRVRIMGYDPAVQIVTVGENQSCHVVFKLHDAFLHMGQMVVTATRSEKILQDVPVATEVIVHDEMRERGAENVAQVLQERPGIVVEPNSSGGQVLRMNGLDAKHVLMLQDGVPIAGKLNSRVEMNLLDVDHLDRIEIVKGPGSALYGSEAMAGVINMISRGFTEQWQAQAGLRSGSFDLYSGHAGLSGSVSGVRVAAGMDYQQGGIDKNEVNINISEQKNNGGFVKLRWDNTTLGSLSAGLDYKKDILDSDDKDRLNRILDHETLVRRTGGHIKWDKTLTKRVAFKTMGYVSDYFRTYSSALRGAGVTSSIDTSKERLTGFRSDFFHQWGKKVLVDFGYDYSHCSFFSVRVKNREAKRDQQGVFGQVEMTPLSALTLAIGGRYDKITDLDGYFSPRFSAMWSLTPQLKLRSSWGQGFRAPNFIDMFTDYRNPYVIVLGNPDLKAEQSQGANAGMEYFWKDRLLMNIAVSWNRFKNMIVDYTMIPGSRTLPSTMSYRNIARSVFTGVEFQSRWQATAHMTVTLNYNYTHLDAEEQTNALNTVYPHTASLRLAYSMMKNRLKLILRDQFYSSRDIKPFDNMATQDYQIVHLGAVDLMDVTLFYQPSVQLAVRMGATNLRDYTNTDYGPWLGRRYFAGVEVTY